MLEATYLILLLLVLYPQCVQCSLFYLRLTFLIHDKESIQFSINFLFSFFIIVIHFTNLKTGMFCMLIRLLRTTLIWEKAIKRVKRFDPLYFMLYP
jgi:hypothetical protein